MLNVVVLTLTRLLRYYSYCPYAAASVGWCPSSAVVENLTQIPKIEGSSPDTGTRRGKNKASILLMEAPASWANTVKNIRP